MARMMSKESPSKKKHPILQPSFEAKSTAKFAAIASPLLASVEKIFFCVCKGIS